MNPDHEKMAFARAELDTRLNKVLVLLAPMPSATGQKLIDVPVAEIGEAVNVHLKIAREALQRFEEAAHGA